MAGLRYLGRAADSDESVGYKKYVDDRWAVVKVDQSYINTIAAAQTSGMVTQSYIDTADSSRATIAAVDAADAGYLAATTRGAANGVAAIGSDDFIPSGQLPTLVTDRVATVVNGTPTAGFTTRTVTSTSVRDYVAGTLTITDPGYPYVVLPFVRIQGGATGATPPANDNVGTGSFGRAQVLGPAPTNEALATALCTGQFGLDFFQATPVAAQNATPLTVVPRTGSLVLDLCLSLWSGTTYTFTSTDLVYYALVFPAG